MQHPQKQHKQVILLGTGLVLGWILSTVTAPPLLQADVRKGATREAFKSGGERAVVTLEKISRQIETMDKRLATIEAAVSHTKKTH